NYIIYFPFSNAMYFATTENGVNPITKGSFPSIQFQCGIISALPVQCQTSLYGTINFVTGPMQALAQLRGASQNQVLMAIANLQFISPSINGGTGDAVVCLSNEVPITLQ